MADVEVDDLEEQFFEGQLGELERRRVLEATGRIAANIAIDLQDGGPLAQYVHSRRLEAAEALRLLTQLDARDAVSITVAQSTVKEYLRVCEWVSARIDDAAQAEQIIEREYNGSSDPSED